MEYPQTLLDIFDDPIFDNVRPKAHATTVDERLIKKLEEITAWVEAKHRMPSMEGDFKEKGMLRALDSMRQEFKEILQPYDRLNLL